MKKKIRILFRTSGGKARGKQLGMGHVFRCLNLAKTMKECESHFLVEDFGGVSDVLTKNHIKNSTKLSKNISEKRDYEQASEYVKLNNIQILIVDKYEIKNSFLKKLKKFVKVIVITDLAKKNFSSDLVINGFIGFNNQVYINKFGTKCLLGPKYQILNRNFEKNSVSKKKIDILATFGGYDEKNIASLFYKIISCQEFKFKTKIISGPVGKKLRKRNKRIIIIQSTDNMQKEISTSRFGFCTGGITTYEFAKEKIPFAIICDDKHQLKTARIWDRKKVAINLGLFNKKTEGKILDVLEKIHKSKLKLRKTTIVDGKGTRRVAREIVKILE